MALRLVWRQRLGNMFGKMPVQQCLPGDIDGEVPEPARRVARYPLNHLAHDPAVQVGHHAELLEHRQEIPRWKHLRFFLPQPNEHFRHHKPVFPELGDRLDVELQLVVGKRIAQTLRGIGPPR
jgi:hypothetical protein